MSNIKLNPPTYSGLSFSEITGDWYPRGDLSTDDEKQKKWKIYNPRTSKSKLDWGVEIDCEDLSILTVDGEEVVGCSEWMRANPEIFEHIVNLHNDWVDQQEVGS